MPFEAAKAITATFCWKIRHVLTPIFGNDYPAMCTPPSERPLNFEHATIDPAIVQKCTELAIYYRSLEPQTSHPVSTTASPASMLTPFTDPTSNYRSHPVEANPRPGFVAKVPRRSYTDSVSSARDSSSEPYCMSPASPVRGGFTPVNAPRSSATLPCVPSPATFFARVVEARERKKAASACGESESEADVSSTPRSDFARTPPFPMLNASHQSMRDGYLASPSANSLSGSSDSDESMATDEESLLDNEDDENYRESRKHLGCPMAKLKKNPTRSAKSRETGRVPSSGILAHEVKAAHALLRLHMQNGVKDGFDEDEPVRDSIWGPLLGSRSQNLRKRRRASL